MLRKIIKIDTEKCNGCGICAVACHESAIAMVDGKAKLIRDDYCDGLGDCLPVCPMNAIMIEAREALPYNEAAVKEVQRKKSTKAPGIINVIDSALRQWPVQIKLVSPTTSFLQNTDLLIAADCAAYAYADFHRQFISGRSILIGCPKLDATDYSQKLTNILKVNEIHSVTVVRMIVPCCGGMEYAANEAIKNCGKSIPCQIVTIDTNGNRI